MADEAVHIGPPAAAQSYLVIEQDRRRLPRRPAPRRCIPATASSPSARPFRGRSRPPASSSSGRTPRAIAAMGDKIESKKAAAAAKVSTVPGHLGVIDSPEQAVEDRRRDRLSGDDQGLGRRRRQGHAHRLFGGRGRGGLRAREVGGGLVLRRRPRLRREVHHRSAPHRDPGARRQARQRHLSRRARVLDPAPQPEGHRGGAVAAARRGDPAQDGRAGGRAGEGGRLRFGRHGRVRRRPGPVVLLPRDEHAPAGRASGDRDDHRHRPRRGDDPGRGRREAAADAGGCEARRLGGRKPHLRRGSDPQLPALDRAARHLSAAARGRARRRRGSQRHRRLRGRRDLDLLRPDDRQARDACADARGGDRGAGAGARRLRDRGHPPQHPVPLGADGSIRAGARGGSRPASSPRNFPTVSSPCSRRARSGSA